METLPPEWDAISTAEMAGYCAGDITATVALCDYAEAKFVANPPFRQIYEMLSLPLQRVLEDASLVGVPIDEPAMRRQLEGFPGRLDQLAEEVKQLTGVAVRLSVPKEIASLLYNHLGLPVMCRTEKGTPSTKKEALALLRGLHPVVDLFEQASAVSSRKKIYTTWLGFVRDGRLHPHFRVTGTATGRVSTVSPTLQNAPREQDVRALFRAPQGCAILVADFVAFEFGIAGWIYHEPAMLEAYRSGDPHSATASDLLGRPPRPGTDERIAWGKAPNLQLLYGQGPSGFYRHGREKWGLTWTLSEATKVHTYWHRRYAGVRPAQAKIIAAQRVQGYLVAPSGRIRRWARIDDSAERAGANFIVQATAAELCHCAAILAMTQSAIPSFGAELILTGHDALMFLLPEASAMPVARLLGPIMADGARRYFAEHFGVEVPFSLKVEIKAGPSWGEVEPIVIETQEVAHD